MKWICCFAMLIFSGSVFAQNLKGAWELKTDEGEHATLIVSDNYLSLALYGVASKNFVYTEGGTYQLKGGEVTYHCEFNSADKEKVGLKTNWRASVSGNVLTLSGNDGEYSFNRIDGAEHPMAGTWAITERATDGVGALIKIHQTGTRKTLKILSGTRFQWVAIDPGVKGFYGTGGGTYTAENGKYVENIAFFSRDNSRVGAKLAFDWKLSNGKWDHSGKSSKGDPIHETWEKIK